MLKETLLATATIFALYVSYYTLVPAWHLMGSAAQTAFNGLNLGSPYSTTYGQMTTNMNIVIQYAFPIGILGLMLYFILLPWLREHDTGAAYPGGF